MTNASAFKTQDIADILQHDTSLAAQAHSFPVANGALPVQKWSKLRFRVTVRVSRRSSASDTSLKDGTDFLYFERR